VKTRVVIQSIGFGQYVLGWSFELTKEQTDKLVYVAREMELQNLESRMHLDGCVGPRDHIGKCWFHKVSDGPQS
jgi:cell division inhibitor SulA